MKHIFLINRFSLRDKTNYMIDKIERAAIKKHLDYKIEINDVNNSTEDIVNKYKKGENIIYAIGGDGVINRVLNEIIGTKNILGFIPCGTGNDFYRTIKETFTSKLGSVDVLKVNNKYFINVACFGIDADIGNNNAVIRSRIIPKALRYKASILSLFVKYKPRRFKVYVNDKIYGGLFSTICACNARYYGGGYKINPRGIINDGKMDVIVANKTNKIGLVNFLIKVKNGKHLKSDEVKFFRTNKMTIKCEDEVSANIDGEILTSDEFVISTTNKKINVYYDEDLIYELGIR